MPTNTCQVKCSSDKPSCQRCLANNFECVYSISMTGKVQGANRHKRARYENSVVPNSPRNPTLLDTINLSSGDEATIVADPAAAQVAYVLPSQTATQDAEDICHSAMLQLVSPASEPALRWPVQDSLPINILFDIEDSFCRPSADEQPHSQQRPECHEGQGQLTDASSMNTGLETSRHGSEACTTRHVSREPSNSGPPEAQPSLRSALGSTSSARDRTPLNCIPLLEQLWQREGCAHLQPDSVIATNKKAVSALSKLVPGLDSCDKGEADLMLYTLVMQAIVNSYRQVCDSWLQAGSDVSGPPNKGPLTPCEMDAPRFRFGTFEIDAESQRKLFTQVVLGEINKAMLLWTKLWAVVSTQQLNGRGGMGLCENILLEAGITLQRKITEISTSL
ncbi:hypothetical protein TrVFT333_000015 [Trichoderma virens FT-333]|nr:hypothetical protein TrVFT333_000015 [Trichoderma virens FT-333]